MNTPIVMAAFVDSPSGWVALERAIAETRLRNGRLVVVHSMEGGDKTPLSEYNRYRDVFERLEERLSGEGIPHDLRELVRGREPAVDIARTAEEIGAELIVIGYRRRSPTGKALLGSDSQEILMLAPCPVLAVRAADDFPD